MVFSEVKGTSMIADDRLEHSNIILRVYIGFVVLFGGCVECVDCGCGLCVLDCVWIAWIEYARIYIGVASARELVDRWIVCG